MRSSWYAKLPARHHRKTVFPRLQPVNIICVAPPHKFSNPFDSTDPRVAKSEYNWFLEGGVRSQTRFAGMRRLRLQVLLDMHELTGHPLTCTCPKGVRCHADTLRHLANRNMELVREWARKALWIPSDSESIWKTDRIYGAIPHCLAALACCNVRDTLDVFHPTSNPPVCIRKAMQRLLPGRAVYVTTQTQYGLPKYGLAMIHAIASSSTGGIVKAGPARPIATAWDGATRYVYETTLGHGNGAWVTWTEWNRRILVPECTAWLKSTRLDIVSWRVASSVKLRHPPHTKIPIGDSLRHRYFVRWRPTTPVSLPSPMTNPWMAAHFGLTIPVDDENSNETDSRRNTDTAAEMANRGPGRRVPQPPPNWDNYLDFHGA